MKILKKRKGKFSSQDYKAAAKQSEAKYQSKSKTRWYNDFHPGPLFPHLASIAIGLSILSGIGYTIAYKLDSMTATIEETNITILKKEYDENIPSKIIYARKDDGEEIKIRNKDSPLERKLNESELDKRLEIGRRYCAEIAHRKDYPIDIYGNLLDIK